MSVLNTSELWELFYFTDSKLKVYYSFLYWLAVMMCWPIWLSMFRYIFIVISEEGAWNLKFFIVRLVALFRIIMMKDFVNMNESSSQERRALSVWKGFWLLNRQSWWKQSRKGKLGLLLLAHKNVYSWKWLILLWKVESNFMYPIQHLRVFFWVF